MDTFDASDLFNDRDEDDQYKDLGFVNQLIFLIDAQPKSLEPCNLPDEEFHGLNWLQASVKLAATMLRSSVIAGGTDEMAVCFYNAATSHGGSSGLEGIYVLQSLQAPDVQRIRDLDAFNMEEFQATIGQGSEAPLKRLQALESGLWQAADMLPSSDNKKRRSIGVQRVLICTPDATPAAALEEAGILAAKAQDIAAKGGMLQLLPLASADEDFDLGPFWWPLLQKGTPQRVGSEDKIGSSLSLEDDEDEERVLNAENMAGVVRMRAYRKRAVTKIAWALGPGGPAIGLKLYSTLQKSWPAVRGAPKYLHSVDNMPLESSSALIDNFSGEIIEGPRLFYPKPDEKSRFPKVYVTKEDVAALKHPLSKGITLLGFKAMDTLEHHHQLRPATFAYPDEATVKGSTRAFVALHSVLLERNMFALCLMVRGPSAEPRLVAAVPQVEEKTGGGAQLVPPGFNFIYLPYSDDVRALEKDPGFTGPERPQPSDAQVAAAATMIDALQLGTEFDPGAVPNPHVQRHFQVLECVALDEDCPEHVRDDAKPDEAAFNAAQPYILAFKESIGGLDAPAGGAGGSRKRKPEASPEDIARQVDDLKFEERAAKGTLTKLTVDQLKLYLSQHNLKKTGKKDELVERIMDHMAKKTKG